MHVDTRQIGRRRLHWRLTTEYMPLLQLVGSLLALFLMAPLMWEAVAYMRYELPNHRKLRRMRANWRKVLFSTLR